LAEVTNQLYNKGTMVVTMVNGDTNKLDFFTTTFFNFRKMFTLIWITIVLTIVARL